MEIGALAGAGLAGLDLNRRDYAYTAARNAETMVGERFDWWFQNRELVEALSVRVALELGRRDEAEQRFRTALAHTEPRDARCAAWLAAECAPTLIAAGADVWDFVRRFSARADDMGYTALATRFRSLLARQAGSHGDGVRNEARSRQLATHEAVRACLLGGEHPAGQLAIGGSLLAERAAGHGDYDRWQGADASFGELEFRVFLREGQIT